MAAFLRGVIVVLILIIFFVIYQDAVAAPRRKAISEHDELSRKLTNTGSETKSLTRAKACFDQLTNSYECIRNYVDANARSCYEDDIELIRDNAEVLAEDMWQSKAHTYLLKMEEAYFLIVNHDFSNIEKAYSSKSVFIKAYDHYFDWTRECYESNSRIWKDVNLWDEAKNDIIFLLDGTGDYVFWDDPGRSKGSVRQQIEENLTKHIESMRPEYLRKSKLKSLILQRIADFGSIQRSVLLKTSFPGFVNAEVKACYRGLAKDHSVIEVKQGSVYFVSLSDAEAQKYPPKHEDHQSQPVPENPADRALIAPTANVLYEELIRRFDAAGLEYVDKTSAGGSLYFFSETEAGNLKDKGYPVYYAEQGTKGTGHRPAWYVRFTNHEIRAAYSPADLAE